MCWAYAVGSVIAVSGSVPPIVWGFGMVLSGILFGFKRNALLLFVMMLMVGAWAAGTALCLPAPQPQLGVILSGQVREEVRVDAHLDRMMITLTNVSIDEIPAGCDVRLYLYNAQTAPETGDTITGIAETWQAQSVRNPGGFDFWFYLTRKGVRLCATAKANEVNFTKGNAFSPGLWLERVRTSVGHRVQSLYQKHPAVARSMLLGGHGMLPEEQLEQFRIAGVVHLLSVSGLHISCMATALSWILRKFGISRSVSFFITLPIIFGYTLLVGAVPSAMRAMLGYTLANGARLDGRPHDGLTGTAAALLILLAINPLSIADPGLILSFLAVLGIFLFLPILREMIRIDRLPRCVARIADVMCVSMSAQLGLLPASCTLYGAITPYALIANLIAVPLSSFALPLIAVSVALSYISGALGLVAAFVPDVIIDVLIETAKWFSNLPYATIYAPAWPWFLCVLYAVIAFSCSPYVRIPLRVRQRLMIAPALVCSLAFALAVFARPQGLAVTFLDAGQADAAVISAEGQVYLADVGLEGGPADDFLRYTGQAVQGVFLTHPHADHAGGLSELLSIRQVNNIYVPYCWHDVDADGVVTEAFEKAVQRGARIHYLSAGDVIQLSDNVRCTVFNPSTDTMPKDANDASLILRIEYGAGSTLITGDVGFRAEPTDILPTTVLKIPHHGSKYSTGDVFLHTVAPTVSVISVGRNGYGHPSPVVLDKLDGTPTHVYRTDMSGAVTTYIKFDGTIEMETFL